MMAQKEFWLSTERIACLKGLQAPFMMVAPIAFESRNRLDGASILSFIWIPHFCLHCICWAYQVQDGFFTNLLGGTWAGMVGNSWASLSLTLCTSSPHGQLGLPHSMVILEQSNFWFFPKGNIPRDKSGNSFFLQLWLKNRSIVMFTVFYCYGNH